MPRSSHHTPQRGNVIWQQGCALSSRARARALVSLAGVGAAAALAAPAIAGAAVTPGRSIEVALGSNMVILGGYPDENVRLDVVRNGVIVGTARHSHNDGATITINHTGEGDCFEGPVTPDLLPGDTLRTTDKAGVVDSETLRDVDLDFPVSVDTDPVTGELTGTITVTGHARSTPEAPIVASDLLEIRLNKAKDSPDWDASGRKDLRGDARDLTSGSTYDAATGEFVHVFDVGVADAADFRAHPGEVTLLWSAGGEVDPPMLVTADEPVEAPGCPPLAKTAMTDVTPDLLNVANTGSSLTVSGAAGPAGEVDGVNVSVGGGPAHAATLSPAASGMLQTWTVAIPAAEVDALADGDIAVTATFSGAAAPTGAQTRTVHKDRAAPAAPGAFPGSGTYTGAQSVVFNPAPGTTVHFTNDGSTPTVASTKYTGPVSVTATQTLKAVAVDAAGNVSPVRTLAYTIAAPTVVQQLPVAGALAGAPVTAATGTTAPTRTGGQDVRGVRAASLAVRNLTVAPRIATARLRAQGLRLSMRAPREANVVRVAVYRARGGRRSGRALIVSYRVPAADGRLSMTLRSRSLLRRLGPGQYVVEARAGVSRSALGSTTVRAFRVTP
jgi:hypothetical protein